MATIGDRFFNLIDKYKLEGNHGEIVQVIEMLSENNEILKDAMAIECNKGDRHMTTVRTGLPSVAWGALYQGVDQSKSTRAQVEDTTGFLEGLSTIDKRILELSDNPGAVRLSEASGFIEVLQQTVATALFYGNTATDPEQFLGFAPRFNDLNAPNGNQIIDAGGTGNDNTSIWFITWGDNQCSMLYPKGSTAGIKREDKGEQKVTDASGRSFWAMEEMFTWHAGLSVRDWRYVSRIANIDVSDMRANNVALYTFMRNAYYKLHNRTVAGGSLAIYCNREVLESLEALAVNAGAGDSFIRLGVGKDIQGEEVLMYRGIPIRETDALLNTEAQVVGL